MSSLITDLEYKTNRLAHTIDLCKNHVRIDNCAECPSHPSRPCLHPRVLKRLSGQLKKEKAEVKLRDYKKSEE